MTWGDVIMWARHWADLVLRCRSLADWRHWLVSGRYKLALMLISAGSRALPESSLWRQGVDGALYRFDLDIAAEREAAYGPRWTDLYDDDIAVRHKGERA